MNTTRTLLRYLPLPLLLIGACAGPPAHSDEVTTLAALQPDAGLLNTTTPLLPVIDITLAGGQSITQLDGTPDVEPQDFIASIKIFESPGSVLVDTLPNIGPIRQTPATLSQSGAVIKRRGSSSAAWPKKNYSLTIFTAQVLGMPANAEWVMHSCWGDKSCLRNYIGYSLARKMFGWAPRTKFAEVFINDEYRGLYLIVEKISLSPQRVNYPIDGDTDTNFIIKRDGNDTFHPLWDAPDWVSSSSPATPAQKTAWYYVSPKPNFLQKTFIQNYMNNTFEPMFTPGNAKYAPANYAQVLDDVTAAKFMVVEEMSNNVDAYWKSMYLTRPKGGKVFMGPVWDLDGGFANDFHDPNACATDNWRIVSAPNFQPLVELWKLKAFRVVFKNLWFSLRVATIEANAIENELTMAAAGIKNARARDEKKWPRFNKVPRAWAECTVNTTFDAEVAGLKTWIHQRMDWMDNTVIYDPNFIK
jgi:hypothetical protein